MYLTDRPTLARSAKSGVRQRVAGTVVLMGLVSMFTDISSESVSAILPLYLTTVVGLGPLAYGFIDGIYQGISALVRILGGWLADRGDHPKWIAFLGYAASAFTRLALIPLHSFAAITTVITIDRLGKGIRTAPRDAVIAASSPPESLGRAFGVHRAMDTAGAVIGPLLAFGVLASVPGDYRSVFVISFAAAIIGLAVLLFIVPDIRPRQLAAKTSETTRDGVAAEPAVEITDLAVVRQPGAVSDAATDCVSATEQPMSAVTGDQTPQPPRPSLRLLLDRRLGLLLAAAGLLGVLTVGDGFIYLSLQHRDDFAIKYFPLLYVGTNIAYMSQALPLGRLADRIGRARVFTAGHLALLLAYLCAGGPASGPVLTIACLLFLGTYYAATDGVLAALAGRLAPVSARASGIATAQTVQAIARFVSSLGFGLMWALAGQRSALLIVAALLAVATPFAWLLLRRTEDRRPPAGVTA